MYNYLTTEELNRITAKSYKKDDVLFLENDICEYAGIVIKGQLIIKSYSLEGKEIIYNIINENEMFGNNLLFSNEPLYKGNVVALKDTNVALIDKEHLLEILKNNDDFLMAYLAKQANNTKNLNEKIKLLSFSSAEERFLYYLKSHSNVIKYNTVTSLAKELSLQRETLSRLLSRLEKNNIITITENEIKRS